MNPFDYILPVCILSQVRHAPQRRGAPRPSQSKPHIVRPVEDITEDELQLIADNMTEKVYNRVTVSAEISSSSVCKILFTSVK